MKGLSTFFILAFLLGAVARQKGDNAVTRVVGLLTDLQTRIEKDGESEQATYDKYACWCEKTTGKTAATITTVKDILKTTGNTILKLKGSVATLSSEIAGLSEDIKKNQDQQAEQTNILEKENASFMAEKVELESASSALEKAIAVLKAATGAAAFVQTSTWASTMSDLLSRMSQASSSLKMNEKQLTLLTRSPTRMPAHMLLSRPPSRASSPTCTPHSQKTCKHQLTMRLRRTVTSKTSCRHSKNS